MTRRFVRLLAMAALVFAASCDKPSPAELMTKARDALADGQPSTAQIHLKNLLRADPNDAAARALLGETDLQLGDELAAEVDLRRALALGGDAADLQLPLLRALWGQGKFSDVLEQIDEGPKLEGDDRAAELQFAGGAYRAMNQPTEAEAAYRAALELRPGAPDIRTDLADFLRVQGPSKEGEDMVAAVLAEYPEFGPALLLRGRFELSSMRLDDAETAFRRAAEVEGKGGGREYVAARLLLIETLLKQGAIDEAAPIAEELLAEHPGERAAIASMAAVEIQQGALDAARERLETLMSRVPSFQPGNRLLGVIAARQSRMGQAQMYLERALTQNPNDGHATLRLAALKLDAGDPEGARSLAAKAVGADASQSDAVVYALAERASLEAGDEDLGGKFFQQSSGTLGDDPKELAAVAAVYASSGQLEGDGRALDLARRAHDAAPNNPEMAYQWAVALARAGRNEQAAGELRNLLDADANFEGRADAERLLRELE